MKLCSLTLENFRQFYGKQHIDFSDSDKNITVVLGENGNGKTGIFRAIVFCLFNEKELPKDRSDRGADPNSVHLVNLNVLKENADIPMDAKVELVFINGNKKYFLQRSVTDMWSTKARQVKKNLEMEVKLSIQNAAGNIESVLVKDADVDKEISGIISSKVKDLFFFDGDKIEALSTTNAKSRDEIKNGIMRLLQIDAIKRAMDITARLKSDQHRIVKGKANTQLQQEEEKLEQLKSELVVDQESFDNKEAELQRVRTNIDNYEREQQENAPIKELFEQRAGIIESKKKTEKIIDDLRGKINNLLSKNGHALLSQDALTSARSFVEQEERDKSYHSGITPDLIDEIIQSQKCICDRTFDVGDETYLRLQELKRKYEKIKLSDFVRDYKRNMKSAVSFGDNVDVEIQTILKDYCAQLDEVEVLRKRLDDIERQKNTYSQNEERLRGIEISLQRCKNDADELNRAIGMLEQRIGSKAQKIATLEQEVKDLRKKDKELHHDNDVLVYYENLNALFTSIRDAYSGKMRARLSEEATEIFKSLISEKDKRVLSQIIINDHYEIQAKGWNDISIFQDISSGQKQMLSLSFVASLARVAAGGNSKVIDMPLFMDTPFAKLDGNNRDNLISTMPELTSQWVLLVTDTEFARSEVNHMKETHKWGKFYRLDKISDGHTEIIAVGDIDSFVANR